MPLSLHSILLQCWDTPFCLLIRLFETEIAARSSKRDSIDHKPTNIGFISSFESEISLVFCLAFSRYEILKVLLSNKKGVFIAVMSLMELLTAAGN